LVGGGGVYGGGGVWGGFGGVGGVGGGGWGCLVWVGGGNKTNKYYCVPNEISREAREKVYKEGNGSDQWINRNLNNKKDGERYNFTNFKDWKKEQVFSRETAREGSLKKMTSCARFRY